MNDLPLRSVGRNHADVCHLPPSGKPLKDIVLTLNLAVQVGLKSEDIEFKVYTPMDVDDLPVNVDEPKHRILPHFNGWKSASGEHFRFDCAPKLTDCQTKSPLSTSNQTFLAPFKFWTASSTAGVGEVGLGDHSGPEAHVQEEVGNHETQQTAFVPLPVSTYSMADIQVG
ncbi:hypothetical protein B0H10DRAFT_1943634 [Mycena sp. CBHHK59/15]|nr:hypothetical protein B0H10DRAFT_1943634 [Mycena sp. CBHHK59/15]